MKFIAAIICTAVFIALQSTAAAAVSSPVSVNSHSGPWLYEPGGLNSAFAWGEHNHIAPSIVDATSGFDFTAGRAITIHYVSGAICAFPEQTPLTDAAGYAGGIPANGDPGSSQLYFPSRFMVADWNVYLLELVGTFANDSGVIVGSPFAIGLDRTVTVPAGATRLQLGVNDDRYIDNTGQLNLSLSQVPEPATLAAPLLFVTLSTRSRRATQ